MDWLFKLFTIAKDLLGHSPQDIKDWLIVLAIAVACGYCGLNSIYMEKNAWTSLRG